MTASTANDRANYAITNVSGSLPILGATLASNQTNVTLLTTGQVEGVVYTLTVNHLTDQCTGGNVIPFDSQATFMALAYTATDIGAGGPRGPGVGRLRRDRGRDGHWRDQRPISVQLPGAQRRL